MEAVLAVCPSVSSFGKTPKAWGEAVASRLGGCPRREPSPQGLEIAPGRGVGWLWGSWQVLGSPGGRPLGG